MNNRLLRKYIKESLGREVMLSPKRLRSRMTGGEQQRELTAVETIDKTSLSDEEVLEELIVAAGPDTYIRFERKYGDLEFPPLKVSPVINYKTPHGIYGYPLDQTNVENLVNSGSPTSADFATNYGFFHVYKLDKSRTANVVARVDDDVNQIIGRYSTEKKVIDDIAECIRVISYLFQESKRNPPVEIPMPSSSLPKNSTVFSIEQDIVKLEQSQSQIDLSDIFNKYKNYVIKTSEKADTSKKLIEFYKQEIASAIFKRKKTSVPTKRRNQNSTKQFLLFKILKSSIGYIAEQFGYSEGVKRSQYYSLLLKSVGITGITDSGTSSIHDNEPSQAVSFDFSGDTIKPIGTFKNIFKSANFDELREKFNQILEDLTRNNIVNWSTNFVNERPNYDYENISLKSFKLLIKTKKNLPHTMTKSFVNNIAMKNKNSDVLIYIYDNKDSFELDGIKDGLFSSLVKNKNLPESIAIEFYKVFVRDNINLGNDTLRQKLGFQPSFFAIDFVRSPALPKEAMLDIVEKSKAHSGGFGMQALKVSNHLDREVSEKIINKFGLEALLPNASAAPITDYYLKHLIEKHDLFSKNLSNLNNLAKEDITEKLCNILRNPHAKDKEIKFVMTLIKPLLKEIASLSSIDAGRMPSYFYEICYSITDENNITADHLSAANLTLEEEAKLLKALTYCLWYNDEENYLDQDENFSMPSYDKFDMLKTGIQYIDNNPRGESIKKALSKSYQYFVNYKKHGVG